MLGKVGVIDGNGSHHIDSHATKSVYQTQLRLRIDVAQTSVFARI